VLYDPSMSERGAMNCVSRAPRCTDPVDVNIKPVIYNPHALPMYKEDFMNFKRKQVRVRAPQGQQTGERAHGWGSDQPPQTEKPVGEG